VVYWLHLLTCALGAMASHDTAYCAHACAAVHHDQQLSLLGSCCYPARPVLEYPHSSHTAALTHPHSSHIAALTHPPLHVRAPGARQHLEKGHAAYTLKQVAKHRAVAQRGGNPCSINDVQAFIAVKFHDKGHMDFQPGSGPGHDTSWIQVRLPAGLPVLLVPQHGCAPGCV
jgi:hypothetical protein